MRAEKRFRGLLDRKTRSLVSAVSEEYKIVKMTKKIAYNERRGKNEKNKIFMILGQKSMENKGKHYFSMI